MNDGEPQMKLPSLAFCSPPAVQPGSKQALDCCWPGKWGPLIYWMNLWERDCDFCGVLSRPPFLELCNGAKPSYPLCLRMLYEV